MIKKYTFPKGAFSIFGLFCLTSLGCFNTQSQTLNFTIDTAVDNGTSITETLMDGSDTYVLTVLHPGNEALDDLGGGDQIFYLSGSGTDPHNVSLTKNGSPVNFTLNGIDYDTLEAGNITVQNQNSDVIAANKNYSLGAGTITITSVPNATDISSFNIIPSDSDDLNDFGFHNINVDIEDPLGIEDEILKNSTSIYPNPTTGDFFYVKNDKKIDISSLSIYDLTGKRVYHTNNFSSLTTRKKINLSGINSGVYLVTISDTNNNSITKKIIIR